MYTQKYFPWSSISLQLKKCLKIPIWDLALFILASIPVSLVKLGVIINPRYLKLFMNWTWLVQLFRWKSFGRCYWLLACFRNGGKYSASDFDFCFFLTNMHLKSKSGEMVMDDLYGFSHFIQGFKQEGSIINIKKIVELGSFLLFHGSVLLGWSESLWYWHALPFWSGK